jgi:lysophospholipase L1-like esterase
MRVPILSVVNPRGFVLKAFGRRSGVRDHHGEPPFTSGTRESTMPHIVLLGDSILDNGAYTGGEPDVVTHLQACLSDGWRCTLHAIDGSRTADLAAQLRRVPADATHLVIAIGGNDALANRDLLATPVRSTAEALALFGERIGVFESAYRKAVDHALMLQRELAICTIYNGNLDASEAPLAKLALTMFNDVILRAAFGRALPVIELRLICTDPGDYANPIEPSGRGGEKIAHAIARTVGASGGGAFSRVYGAAETSSRC